MVTIGSTVCILGSLKFKELSTGLNLNHSKNIRTALADCGACVSLLRCLSEPGSDPQGLGGAWGAFPPLLGDADAAVAQRPCGTDAGASPTVVVLPRPLMLPCDLTHTAIVTTPQVLCSRTSTRTFTPLLLCASGLCACQGSLPSNLKNCL